MANSTSPEARLAGWAGAYFTTANFREPDMKRGLFDITTIPAAEFRKAPVHAWVFDAWDAATGRQADAGARVPAGRLILWFENTIFVSVAVTALTAVNVQI